MPRPVRVLQVIYRADRAGAETWLVHLLRHIDRKDVEIDFVVHDKASGAHDSEIQKLGAKIFICDRHRNLWRQFWRLRSILREHGPYDAVHSHVDHFGGVIVFLARLLGISARIAHFHNDSPDIQQETTFSRRLYERTMRLMVCKFATAGRATSGVAASAMFGPKWRSDARWGIHSACVDLQRFADPVDRAKVRAEFGIPPDALVFGHVGRFVDQKNHDFLLRVAEVLSRRNDHARFYLIGSGPRCRDIEALINKLGLSGRIVVLTPRDDIPRLMLGAFDCFLFPSRWEGLGLALVEAQAAGLPCFVSTVIPRDAIVVPSLVERLPLSEGPDFWADAILRRIHAPSPVTRGEALRSVVETFDIRRNAAKLVEFYREVTA